MTILIREVEEKKEIELKRLAVERKRENHLQKLVATESATLAERKRVNDLLVEIGTTLKILQSDSLKTESIKGKLELIIQLLIFKLINDGIAISPELMRETGSSGINITAHGDLNLKDVTGRDKK